LKSFRLRPAAKSNKILGVWESPYWK